MRKINFVGWMSIVVMFLLLVMTSIFWLMHPELKLEDIFLEFWGLYLAAVTLPYVAYMTTTK